MSYKPTVVFDFDGVINSYASGWKGIDIIPDPPVEGIRDAIDEIRCMGYKVVVVSTRCADPEGLAAVMMYLSNYGFIVDGVMAEKPPAICYIDDRAICFDGDASSLPEKVKNFKNWIEIEKDGESADIPNKTVIYNGSKTSVVDAILKDYNSIFDGNIDKLFDSYAPGLTLKEAAEVYMILKSRFLKDAKENLKKALAGDLDAYYWCMNMAEKENKENLDE